MPEEGVVSEEDSVATIRAMATQAVYRPDFDDTDLSPAAPVHLYAESDTLESKLTAVATKLYGAASVRLSPGAERDLERLRAARLDHLPHLNTADPRICGSQQ